MDLVKLNEILSKKELDKLPDGIGDLKIPSRYKDGKKKFDKGIFLIQKDWNDYVFIGKTHNGGIMEISQRINPWEIQMIEYDTKGNEIHTESRIYSLWR